MSVKRLFFAMGVWVASGISYQAVKTRYDTLSTHFNYRDIFLPVQNRIFGCESLLLPLSLPLPINTNIDDISINHLFTDKNTSVYAAGCIFTNGTHILAGLQQKGNKHIISGIGGKCEPNECVNETAIRETIEELLNIQSVDIKLIREICDTIKPKHRFINNNYGILVYDFDQLIVLLHIVHKYYQFDFTNSTYVTFPLNLTDLLFYRNVSTSSEISILCLLPITQNINIDKYFVSDIDAIFKIGIDI